jgi:hypothetical protein
MLCRDEELPLIGRMLEMRARVSREVPEDVLLERRLGVRRIHSTKTVEAREQRATCVRGPMIHAAVASPTGGRIRLIRSQPVDQLAERANRHFVDAHAASDLQKP